MEEKQRNIEREIDSILESLEGIESASENPFLYEKVMNRMKMKHQTFGYAKIKYTLIAVILILINIYTFVFFSTTETASIASSNENSKIFAEEYYLINSTYKY